jgi:simple sugar transport system ATP-binding protein
MAEALVRMENISKSFGNIKALEGVELSVAENEIVGLVGDNGAGKSTLIKILSGAVAETSGDIFFRGNKVNIRNTRDGIDLGIETIYQDSALVNQLSIARNLFLGREPSRKFGFINRLDKPHMNAEAQKLLRKVGITKRIDPNTPINSLSGGERQSIAIARAMYFKAPLIIMDEPTNNLGVEETRGVLNFIKEAKADGHSSIFIAHNIHHVFQVVDRIVILRLGKNVANLRREDTTMDEVERIITGVQDGVM